MADHGTLEATPDATGAAEFRQFLLAIGETQSSFARLLKDLGDDRRPATILRSVVRFATGEARVSGEMRALMTVMRRMSTMMEQTAQPRRNALLDLASETTSAPVRRNALLNLASDATPAPVRRNALLNLPGDATPSPVRRNALLKP